MERKKKKITEIKAGKRYNGRRSSIYLNGKFAFSLDNEVISQEKLIVGLVLSDERVETLEKSDARQKCLSSALQFLSFRPRSESELIKRLSLKKYTEEEIEDTVIRLRKMRLLDDSDFADFWKENRNEFKPLSRNMLKRELKLKGVESQVIEDAIEDIDDEENAYRAAQKKAASLQTGDYQMFLRRLGSFLQRRGFGYTVINRVVKRIWLERSNNPEIDSGTFNDIYSGEAD